MYNRFTLLYNNNTVNQLHYNKNLKKNKKKEN